LAISVLKVGARFATPMLIGEPRAEPDLVGVAVFPGVALKKEINLIIS